MSTTLHRDSWDQYVAITEKQIADQRAEIERVTAENERLRAAFSRLMVCGNHTATHHKPRWPDYRLDGLTREQQCEHALRTLGATVDYDMWVCWSGMMQERDALDQQKTVCSTCGGSGVEKAIAGDGYHWCPDCRRE